MNQILNQNTVIYIQMRLKMPAKWWSFCLGQHVLKRNTNAKGFAFLKNTKAPKLKGAKTLSCQWLTQKNIQVGCMLPVQYVWTTSLVVHPSAQNSY